MRKLMVMLNAMIRDYHGLQPIMEGLLQSHGLMTSTYKEWVLGSTELPGLRACLYNGGRHDTARLVVELLIGKGQIIVESFAGVGEDEEKALMDAVENFCNNSLHVFLAAFWNHIEPEQVTVEKWQINGATWSVYIGNYYVRGATDGEDVRFPARDAFPLTEAWIKKLPLQGDFHWVRTFYGSWGVKDQQKKAETLLDNEVWADFQDLFLRLPWPPRDKYYSARNFLVLKKHP
jgi:hypothetical protein